MERVLSVNEASEHFSELVREATEHHEPIIIGREGEPQIVVLSIAEYERLRDSRPNDWRAQLDAVHALIRRERGDKPLPPPEEIIRAMREEQDEQLLDNLC